MGQFFLEKGLHLFLKRQAGKKGVRAFNPSDIGNIRRILLMTTTAIGDTLLSTPAIRAVKERYPDKEVHVLCHARNQLLLQENPYISRLLLYQGKRKGIWSLVKNLQSQKYDLVVILHSNDPEAVPLAWVTGAPYIIGPGVSRFAYMLSQSVFCHEETRHAIERRLDLVRVIGADTENKAMDLFLSSHWRERSRSILEKKWKTPKGPLIGVHPTGSGAYKWWPKEYFSTVLRELSEKYQARFILISTPKEAVVARAIAGNLEKETLVVQGEYDLLESAALMKQCALIIANDSGPLHMALALGIPTLALIGADSPLRIGPYQVSNSTYLYRKEEVCPEERCLNQKCRDNRCLKAITPEEVLGVIEERFGKALKSRELNNEFIQ
jgi:ADP-heptose:LPS heptosyltransferase